MLSSNLYAMLPLSKTTSPPKTVPRSDCMTLYVGGENPDWLAQYQVVDFNISADNVEHDSTDRDCRFR